MHWTTQSACFMGEMDQIQVSDSLNTTLTLEGFQLGPPRALKGPHLAPNRSCRALTCLGPPLWLDGLLVMNQTHLIAC